MAATTRFHRMLASSILAGAMIALALSTNALALTQQEYTPAAQAAPVTSYQQADSSTSALNWAGYVATGGTYTSVSGSWIVPTVAAGSSHNVADATWVGIGGVSSKDLIQAGTEAIPNSDGTLSYQAWLELLPQDSRVVPLTISPGDSVSVAITESGTNMWQISFVDITTGRSYSTSVNYDSSLSSADWIEEMPVEVGGVVALDNFGQIDFSGGYTVKNGQAETIQASGAQALNMNNAQGETVATTSVIGQSGSSFAVTRTNVASTPLALSRNGVSAVAAGSAPYAYTAPSSSYSYGGGRGVRIHRNASGYRIVLTF